MHGDPWPVWLSVDARESGDSSAEFYLEDPDGRVISAFFLSCVFMSSLQHLTRSSFFRDLLRKAGRFLKSPQFKLPIWMGSNDLEALSATLEKPEWEEREAQAMKRKSDKSALVFTLNLSLILASLAMFLSVLNYSGSNGSESICTFVIAWGGMAAGLAKLIGFVILKKDLGRNLARSESWCVWGSLIVALGFNLAYNATNTGTTSTAASTGAVFCYQTRYLFTALASSIAHFVIELYFLVRLLWLRIPGRTRLRDRLVGFKMLSIGRVCSLIALDALTVVPNAIPTNIFAQFIPFSMGALVVLVAFNIKAPSTPSPLPSVIVNSKKRPATDLLAPTPFTLHFSAENEQEDDPHSSRSPHLPPPGGRYSRTGADTIGGSMDQASMDNVENAVITRASAAWRRSVKKLSLAFPHPRSAPAKIGTFFSASREKEEHTRYPHKIISSQVEVAARLEREDSNRSKKIPEPLKGLSVPPSSQRPYGTIEIEDESGASMTGYSGTPRSTVFGSDIIQLTPSKRRVDGAVQRSSSNTQSSDAFSPTSRLSTQRHSFASSRWTDRTSDESSNNDERSAVTSASTSRHQSFLSPDYNSPRRTKLRFSAASAPSKLREELHTVSETVSEMLPEAGKSSGDVRARKASGSRRRTFGSAFSVRRSKKDAVTDLLVLEEPMPPRLAHIPARPPPIEPLPPLPPAVKLQPATPDPGFEATSPPLSSPRIWPLSGKVKGPRPLPSALLPDSGWPQPSPEQEVSRDLRRSMSRRSSYPSLYSQEKVVLDRRRPSAGDVLLIVLVGR